MDSLSLWEVINGSKRFYFDTEKEALEYCSANEISPSMMGAITFFSNIYGKNNVVEIVGSDQTINYLKIGEDKVESYSSFDNGWSLVDGSVDDYQDLYDAFKRRGIDIVNGSNYTLFFYRGFVYDYSREAMEYLKGKQGVYRVDYYRKLDGVTDAIRYFNRDYLKFSQLIYSDGFLGYRIIGYDGKARPFIDAQYLTCEDIDNWYSVLEGRRECIRVSRESGNSYSVLKLESGSVANPIRFAKNGLLRRILQK